MAQLSQQSQQTKGPSLQHSSQQSRRPSWAKAARSHLSATLDKSSNNLSEYDINSIIDTVADFYETGGLMYTEGDGKDSWTSLLDSILVEASGGDGTPRESEFKKQRAEFQELLGLALDKQDELNKTWKVAHKQVKAQKPSEVLDTKTLDVIEEFYEKYRDAIVSINSLLDKSQEIEQLEKESAEKKQASRDTAVS
ncbi:hypothetical protein QFC19_004964 [Naganishia cerealis]|uniref:Uncharacterized protein n=1 Tax=Naganishia cerealis TaxID=610337 RepID=A0ACC2VSC4_9TREE|nr:hypothetical protein QFC19_004964 [Naganishia cerealis]